MGRLAGQHRVSFGVEHLKHLAPPRSLSVVQTVKHLNGNPSLMYTLSLEVAAVDDRLNSEYIKSLRYLHIYELY